jgi:hypothetical protein
LETIPKRRKKRGVKIMQDFTILKKEKHNGEYFSILLKDNKKDIKFWLDCSLIDGYGNRTNYKTKDLYIDWEFNQYIFHLDYIEDVKAKEYQENGENIDNISYFIDSINYELVQYFKEV